VRHPSCLLHANTTELTGHQVLIGGSLFHLLPDITEGSNEEFKQVLIGIILIVISLMVGLDSFVELQSSNKVQPAIMSLTAPDDGVDRFVSVAPSSQSADGPADGFSPHHLQPQQHQQKLSYPDLLQQPGVMVNLIGEAVHNLTDGIAIATAFSLSWESGL
jgi:zinc transporter ZupT